MGAVKAKMIRKWVYGEDGSPRAREYKDINGPWTRHFPDGKGGFVVVKCPGTLVNVGLRSKYLMFKDEYKRASRRSPL